jgi:hypothetical protein
MSIIRLTTCNNIIEATMLKDILENEQIKCFLTNENFTNLMPGYNGMFGAGIQIMIDDKDSDKANKLISSQTQSNDIICPNCNSTNFTFGIGTNRFKKILIILLSVFFLVPFNNIKNTYYCKDCKTEFKF